jgi:hypothetical protein
MPIRTLITIERAEQIHQYCYDAGPDDVIHVFVAEASPRELRRAFGTQPPRRVAGYSVLNVLGHPHAELREDEPVSLTIDPDSAELVALGVEDFVLICEGFDNEDEAANARLQSGDREFIARVYRLA